MATAGQPRKYPYTLDETNQKIELYKDLTAEGYIKKPCWPDFLARNGIGVDEAKRMIDNYGPGEYELSRALKRMLEWCQAQIMTSDGWSGSSMTKAIFLAKQDFGGGVAYSDRQDVKTDSRVEISIKFGGKSKDPLK